MAETTYQSGQLVELDARERVILEYRLLAEDPKSHAWLAERLDVTPERVRQLESRLRSKIRRGLYVEFPALNDGKTPPPAPRKLLGQ